MVDFVNYNPILLFLYFASTLCMVMFVNNPIVTIIFLLAGIVFNIQLTDRRKFCKSLPFYVTMLLMITITNPIFVHNGATPLFFLNGNPVTVEALAYGLELSLMLITVIIWFNCFNIVLTSEKIIFIFGKIIPRISLILTMVLRYVPLLKVQFRNIKNARITMGLFNDSSKVDYIKSSLTVLSIAMSMSFENAIETANSMNGRGYAAKLSINPCTKKRYKKTNFAIYKLQRHDVAFMVALAVSDLFLILEIATKHFTFSFYPVITNVSLDVNFITSSAVVLILAFMPIIVNTISAIRWHILSKKIINTNS